MFSLMSIHVAEVRREPSCSVGMSVHVGEVRGGPSCSV